MQYWVVDVQSAQQPLLTYLQSKLTNWTKSKINREIDKGNIKVNGKKAHYQQILQVNDQIKIYTRAISLINNLAKQMCNQKPLVILYEDQHLLVVDKPVGISCQPNKADDHNHLLAMLQTYLYQKNDPAYQTVRLCHRLDKMTRGLCLATKNSQTHRLCMENWHSDQIAKYYLALCLNPFVKKKGIWKNAIANKQTMVSHYQVLQQYKTHALVRIKLETGHKHQIRQQAAWANHPILGDPIYNRQNQLGYQNLCLVAYEIVFNWTKQHQYLTHLNQKRFVLTNWTGFTKK